MSLHREHGDAVDPARRLRALTEPRIRRQAPRGEVRVSADERSNDVASYRRERDAAPCAPPPPPASSGIARSPTGKVSSIGQLAGVRERDADVSIERRTRKATPRIAFTPGHALAAILLLVAVTCTSLTLLVRQSLNYAEAGRASAGRSSVQTYEAQQVESSDGTQSSGRLSLQGQSGSGNEEETNRQSAGGQDESSEPSGSAQTEQPQAQANGGLININTATLEELDSINGIGPVTAQKILDHRKRIGRFSSVDQLLEVSGIGTKTLEKMRSKVTV